MRLFFTLLYMAGTSWPALVCLSLLLVALFLGRSDPQRQFGPGSLQTAL